MRDENAGIVVMDKVNHTLGVGESLGVELKAAPLVLFPVEPVLHHHVDRNLTLAELSEGCLHLILSEIFLAALPESECPLRHHLGTTGEEAIALDYVIITVAGDEVVVHLLVHLSPDRHPTLLCLSLRCGSTQSAVCHATVRLPFNSQWSALAFLEIHLKLICIGVPSRAPALGHYQSAAHIHLHISRVIKDEAILGCCGSLYFALIYDVRLAKVDVLRQKSHHARVLVV